MLMPLQFLHGPPRFVQVWREAEIRFWSRVEYTDECWLWRGSSTRGRKRLPYGRFHFGGREMPSHRVAYELVYGSVPLGLQLDHLCMVPECVNPRHLEPTTGRENILRSPRTLSGQNLRKTACPRGHPYSGVNSQGSRICIICQRESRLRYSNKYYAEKRLDPEWVEMQRQTYLKRRDTDPDFVERKRKSGREYMRRKAVEARAQKEAS